MGELEEILEAEREHENTGKRVQKQLKKLATKIKQGNYSTGDPVKDFIISAYQVPEFPKVEDTFRQVQEQVAAHQGQLVMYVELHTRWEGEDSCMGGGR